MKTTLAPHLKTISSPADRLMRLKLREETVKKQLNAPEKTLLQRLEGPPFPRAPELVYTPNWQGIRGKLNRVRK